MKTTVICLGEILETESLNQKGIGIIQGRASTQPQYLKVKGEMVKYYHCNNTEALNNLWHEQIKKNTKCMICVGECTLAQELKQKITNVKGMQVLYVPYMQYLEVERLLEGIFYLKQRMKENSCVENLSNILLGKGQNIGEVLMDLLSKFEILEKSKDIHLYLDLPITIGLNEVSEIEDVLKDYLKIECTLSIDTACIYKENSLHGYAIYMQ